MRTWLLSTILFFILMVGVDVLPMVLNLLVRSDFNSISKDVLEHLQNEVHWLSKIIGSVIFGAIQFYILKSQGRISKRR